MTFFIDELERSSGTLAPQTVSYTNIRVHENPRGGRSSRGAAFAHGSAVDATGKQMLVFMRFYRAPEDAAAI
jgi:hypothetical protein